MTNKRFSKLDYTFSSFVGESLDNIKYNDDDKLFAIKILEEIDNQIGSIDTQIKLDDRPNKATGKKIFFSQFMDNKDRTKYTNMANEIIEKHKDLELVTVSPGRRSKDYAFKHKDMSKYVYVNCRPNGKRSSLGSDPNELMAAALCLKSSLKIPTTVDEMDALIDDVRLALTKVKGYKQSQVDSLSGDYTNLCQAVSAAIAVHDAGYGGADVVYLTGQAWDDDVKQFQITKYGMKDFNSSDFIVKKGDSYLGVSLKKKMRIKQEDPTLINKAFSSLLQDSKFSKIMKQLDDKTGLFYLKVLARGKREGKLSKQLLDEISKTRPTVRNWKKFIQQVDNDLVNRELKSSRSLFKSMADIIMANKLMIADQLIQLIFKADLKDLKQVNFDFALVTGIGVYGVRKGVSIEKGDYKDVDTITTKLNELATKGDIDLVFTPGAKQPFDEGATAAILKFDILMAGVPLCNVSLRYKGDFRSAPNFLAVMTPEFKEMYK